MFGSQRTGTRAAARSSAARASSPRPVVPRHERSSGGGRDRRERERRRRAPRSRSTTSARACSIAARPSTTHVPVGPIPASSPASRPMSVAPTAQTTSTPCAVREAHDRAAHPPARADHREAHLPRAPARTPRAPPRAPCASPSVQDASGTAHDVAASAPRIASAAFDGRRVRLEEHRLVHREERQVGPPRLVSRTRRARGASRATTSAGSTFDVTLMTPARAHREHRQRQRVVAAQHRHARAHRLHDLLRAEHVARRLLRGDDVGRGVGDARERLGQRGRRPCARGCCRRRPAAGRSRRPRRSGGRGPPASAGCSRARRPSRRRRRRARRAATHAMASRVEFEPVPATTCARPFARWTVRSTTARVLLVRERRALAGRPARDDARDTPPATCASTSASSASQSTGSPGSSRNGVTSAVYVPSIRMRATVARRPHPGSRFERRAELVAVHRSRGSCRAGARRRARPSSSPSMRPVSTRCPRCRSRWTCDRMRASA